jgi:hypothetical protein
MNIIYLLCFYFMTIVQRMHKNCHFNNITRSSGQISLNDRICNEWTGKAMEEELVV